MYINDISFRKNIFDLIRTYNKYAERLNANCKDPEDEIPYIDADEVMQNPFNYKSDSID